MAGMTVKFSAIDEVSPKYNAIYDEGQKVTKQFDEMEDAVCSALETLGEMADQAASEVISAADATDYWTDALGNYNEGAMLATHSLRELIDEGYMTEDVLTDMAASIDETTDKLKDYEKGADGAGDSSEEFGDTSVNAMESLSSALVTLGIVKAIQEIGEAFMECSEAASEFETNVAMVSTVADQTILSADELSAQIRATSMDTAQSVNELSESSYNAISAGVDTASAVSAVGDATKLAVAGFTDATSALSVLTTATNAYQLEASEMNKISDSLITSQNLGVMTIDQLSSTMGKAISTASAYSVDLYNLESGYISLTKAGISVEESTTYISSMFNELGSSGSAVAKVIMEETGESFGQLMQDGYSLADVLGIVYESVDKDSEALMNLWGSAEAGKAANAVINQGLNTFNENLEKLHNSAGTTEAAYETMTNTSAFATQRIQNSFENLKIVIGDDLNPVIADLHNGIADVTDTFTVLIEEHPALTAVITGVTVGIGSVTLAIAAYTAVTKIAEVVSATFGETMIVAFAPLALAAVAIGAVAGALIYFANIAEDRAAVAMEKLTATSQAQNDELEALNEEYKVYVEAGEEGSEAALRLRAEIDDLTESFEANKQTIGDLISFADNLENQIESINTTYEEAVTENNSLRDSSVSLVAQLAVLSDKSRHTESELQLMNIIVDQLNSSYEGLNVTLDETTGKLNMSVADMYEAVIQAADEANQQAATEKLVGLMQEYEAARSNMTEAAATVGTEWKNYEEMEAAWISEHPIKAWLGEGAEMNWDKDLGQQYTNWEMADEAAGRTKEEYDNLVESIRECYTELGYTDEEIEEAINLMENAGVAAEMFADSSEDIISQEEAEVQVISGVSDQLQVLCEAYNEAYQSALESVQGQYSLWDSVDEVVAMTAADITGALQSQIDYWSEYSANLDNLTEKAASIEGLGDVLDSIADGSENSAAMLAGMSSMSDEELSAMVEQYNSLQASQSDTAESMADLAANFSAELDGMVTDMEDAVTKMNMEDEAKAAATATMDAYIAAIRSKTFEANSALSALSFANNGLSGLNGYATGTLDAEPGLALVGENGPELVNFKGGEVVYTSDETENILSASLPDSSDSGFYIAPPSEAEQNAAVGERTVTLKIEGAGEIKVGNGLTKEAALEIMMDNLKDSLMGIIRQEIMEEGDLAYEF